MCHVWFATSHYRGSTLWESDTKQLLLLDLPWAPWHPVTVAVNCLCAYVLYLHLFCAYAFISKICSKLIASLLCGILVYNRFLRNALLLDRGHGNLYMIFQVSSPILWVVFSLSWQCPLMNKDFNFDEVKFNWFFFCCSCFWCQIEFEILSPGQNQWIGNNLRERQ